jgi:hypothetical protein
VNDPVLQWGEDPFEQPMMEQSIRSCSYAMTTRVRVPSFPNPSTFLSDEELLASCRHGPVETQVERPAGDDAESIGTIDELPKEHLVDGLEDQPFEESTMKIEFV